MFLQNISTSKTCAKPSDPPTLLSSPQTFTHFMCVISWICLRKRKLKEKDNWAWYHFIHELMLEWQSIEKYIAIFSSIEWTTETMTTVFFHWSNNRHFFSCSPSYSSTKHFTLSQIVHNLFYFISVSAIVLDRHQGFDSQSKCRPLCICVWYDH